MNSEPLPGIMTEAKAAELKEFEDRERGFKMKHRIAKKVDKRKKKAKRMAARAARKQNGR